MRPGNGDSQAKRWRVIGGWPAFALWTAVGAINVFDVATFGGGLFMIVGLPLLSVALACARARPEALGVLAGASFSTAYVFVIQDLSQVAAGVAAAGLIAVVSYWRSPRRTSRSA